MIGVVKSNTQRLFNTSKAEREWIVNKLTFSNPKYESAAKFSPYGKPPVTIEQFLVYYKDTSDYLEVPLNFPVPFKQVLIADNRVERTIDKFPKLAVELREGQKKEFDAYINSNDKGQLFLDTGEGKTILGYAIASHLKQKTLILVEQIPHMKAWIDDLTVAFGGKIPKRSMGKIQGKEYNIGKYFTIATFQTLNNRDLSKLSEEFGLIIHDEGHHAAAKRRFEIISSFKCKYRLSLTGTDKRTDNLQVLHQYLYGSCPLNLIGQGKDITGVDVYRIDTEFFCKEPRRFRKFYQYNGTSDLDEVISTVDLNKLREFQAKDEHSTELLLHYALKEIMQGNKCIIFTHRRFHVVRLAMYLKLLGVNCRPLYGETPNDLKYEIIDQANAGKVDCIISTFNYIKESQNLPEFSVGFAVTTTMNKVELQQASGRVRRKAEGKKVAKWYDFYSSKVPTLKNHSQKRLAIWKSLGYKVYNIKGE